MNFEEQLQQARKFAVPLIAINTPDQLMMLTKLGVIFGKPLGDHASVVVKWDIANRLEALGAVNPQVIQDLNSTSTTKMLAGPFDALKAPIAEVQSNSGKHQALPDFGTIVILLADRYLVEPAIIQAVMNLREKFKMTNRTLVLVGQNFRMPPELQGSFLIVDDPLPTDDEIHTTVSELYTAHRIKADDATLKESISAYRGLPMFMVEQSASLSIKKIGKELVADKDEMWAQKRVMIKQVRGLTAPNTDSYSFDSIGGLAQIKKYFMQYFAGPHRPNVICFIDEIDKGFSALGINGIGDNTGATQDQLNVFLQNMEDEQYSGIMMIGPRGTCKTYFAYALAGQYKVPMIKIDLGAMKDKGLGDSEKFIRNAIQTINAVAGHGKAFFVSTCNRLNAIPPELQRRFRSGIWFADLPDAEERKVIGKIQCQSFGISYDAGFWMGLDGYSGSDIRDVCYNAQALCTTPAEAKEFVVPAWNSAKDSITQLRTQADGTFLSVSLPGYYKHRGGVNDSASASVTATPRRRFEKSELN